jgi:hypothetical protein
MCEAYEPPAAGGTYQSRGRPTHIGRCAPAATRATLGTMHQDTSPGTLRGALRRCAGTRGRRWLVAAVLLLGATVAAAAPAGRTFVALSDPVQSLMSALLPLLGILLVRDLRDAPRFLPSVVAAVLVAAAVGAFGVAACAVALAVRPAGAAGDPRAHVAVVAAGGVLVQVVAQLVGTGMGLLLRSAPAAFLATFLPFVLWLALGAADVLRPGQDWLTPYETARHLLSGRMSALAWLQWAVVALLWGAGLNAAGVAAATARARRRSGG